jgi:large subunit ribosomal protein L49
MALSHGSALCLSFLRPLALPRASTIHHFFSASASTSSTSTSPLINSSSASIPIPPPTSPQAEETLAHTTSTSKPTSPILRYRVNRTPSSNLPVYLLGKRGGNLKQTKLRKIEGDINTLRIELRDELKLNDKDIVINQVTKHIMIRVSYCPRVGLL